MGHRKLPTTMLFCSSEDEQFPVSELTRPVPTTRGWQSTKHPTFPQQLSFRFDGPVYLHQLQLLAHESKIPYKVEVFTSPTPPNSSEEFPPLESEAFTYMGYVSFTANREGVFKSGELRSCQIDEQVLYVKLVLWEPHGNALNFYGQVGLSSITCVGTLLRRLAPSTMFPHQRSGHGGVTTLHSHSQRAADRLLEHPDDSVHAAQHGATMATPLDKLIYDLTYDAQVIGKINEVIAMKEHAVQQEDYALARRLKETIDTLYPLGLQIQQIQARKRVAMLDEDFQLAGILKEEEEEMRMRVMSIRVGPGGTTTSSPVFGSSVHHQRPVTMLSPTQLQMPAQRTPAYGSPQPLSGGRRVQQSQHASPAGAYGANDQHQHQPQQQQQPPPMNTHPLTHDEQPAVATGNNYDDAGGIVATGSAAPTGVAISDRDMMHYDVAIADLIAKAANDTVPPEDVRKSTTDVPTFAEILAGLGVYTTCCLFSKRHALREAACKVVREHGDRVLNHVDANQLVSAVVMFLGTRLVGLADPVNTVFFAAVDLMHAVMEGKLAGECTTALKKFGAPLLQSIVGKFGDANQKVRDAAIDAAEAMMSHPAYGLDVTCRTLTDTAKAGNNFKMWLSRLTAVEYALVHVLPPKSALDDVPALALPRLMANVVEKGLQHANNAVRERAVDVLCVLHERVGPQDLDPYIKKQKPSMQNIINERLNGGGNNTKKPPPKRQGRPARDDADEGGAHAEAPPGGPRRGKAPARLRSDVRKAHDDKPAEEDMYGAGSDEEEPTSALKPAKKPGRVVRRKNAYENVATEGAPGDFDGAIASAQPTASKRPAKRSDDDGNSTPAEAPAPVRKRRAPPKPIAGECQFCNTADDAFKDHNELVQHFMSECPMMCICPLCQLPIEIRDVHVHLIEDCEYRNRLSCCPRCLEAVRNEKYDEHVRAKNCTLHSDEYIVCPLCRARLPDSDAFWEVHIMNPPFCKGNPRTFTE